MGHMAWCLALVAVAPVVVWVVRGKASWEQVVVVLPA